jgi:uncharacterized protein YyaL (SSP411 family)
MDNLPKNPTIHERWATDPAPRVMTAAEVEANRKHTEEIRERMRFAREKRENSQKDDKKA